MSNIKNNILSLDQLLEKGYNIHMKNKSLSMSDKYVSLIFNMYIIRNRMFLLNIQNDTIKCLKSCVNNLSWI